MVEIPQQTAPVPAATRPTLSIVVVSYNTAALLRRCLASLPAATGTVPAEVIVVDNASSDGSADLVAAEFPAVRMLRQPRNTGFADATNQGLQLARGDVLCLLNPDTEAGPSALALLVDWLAAHPAAGVAAPRLLNPDGTTQATGFRFPGIWQVLFDWFPPPHRLPTMRLNGRYPASTAPFRIDHPLGACFAVRRAAAVAVGLLDAGYFMYSEEVDWCRRLAAAGWEIWSLPAATVVHHGGASTRQQPARMFEELHRSRDRYLRRWLPPPAYVLIRLITRAGTLAEAIRTFAQRRAGRLTPREATDRIRACGRIARGWPAPAPARIARLPAEPPP
jgi:GT2 family glycosyltransferase